MSHSSQGIALRSVESVTPDRLQKATNGLADQTLTVQVTGQSPTEVKGFVRNSAGKQYAITLTVDRAFCECLDSRFRHSICYHATALALHVLRTPQAEVEEEPEARPVNLGLR